jgi:hypothetical protein
MIQKEKVKNNVLNEINHIIKLKKRTKCNEKQNIKKKKFVDKKLLK